jgi:hypothetical protein
LDDKLYSDPNFNKKIPSIVKQGINTPKQLEIFFTTIKEETDKIVNEWTSSTEKARKTQPVFSTINFDTLTARVIPRGQQVYVAHSYSHNSRRGHLQQISR